MAIVRSNGGTEKVTIDGEKVHEKINLKKDVKVDFSKEKSFSIAYNQDLHPIRGIQLKEPYSVAISQHDIPGGNYMLAIYSIDIETGKYNLIENLTHRSIVRDQCGTALGEYVYYSWQGKGTKKANLRTKEITVIDSSTNYKPIFSFKGDIYLGGSKLNPDGSLTYIRSLDYSYHHLFFENEKYFYLFPEYSNSDNRLKVSKFDGKTVKKLSKPCEFQNGGSGYVYEENGTPILFSHADDTTKKMKVYRLNDDDTFTKIEERADYIRGYAKFKGKTYAFCDREYDMGNRVFDANEIYQHIK